MVFVFLPCRSQPCGFEDVAERFVDPERRRILDKLYSSKTPAYVRFPVLANQSLNLVLVGVKDILLTSPKVRMDLAWEESILRNVCVS